MQQDSIDCAAQAMEKFNIEKDIAACESPAARAGSDGGALPPAACRLSAGAAAAGPADCPCAADR